MKGVRKVLSVDLRLGHVMGRSKFEDLSESGRFAFGVSLRRVALYCDGLPAWVCRGLGLAMTNG